MMNDLRTEALNRIDAVVADCQRIAAQQEAAQPLDVPVARRVPGQQENRGPAIRLSHLSLDQLQHLRASLDILLRERRTPVPPKIVEETVRTVPVRYEANVGTPNACLFKLREAARSLRLQRWSVESIAAGLTAYGEEHHPDDVRAGLVAMAVAEGLADADMGDDRRLAA